MKLQFQNKWHNFSAVKKYRIKLINFFKKPIFEVL
jgi:hypothetical protein